MSFKTHRNDLTRRERLGLERIYGKGRDYRNIKTRGVKAKVKIDGEENMDA